MQFFEIRFEIFRPVLDRSGTIQKFRQTNRMVRVTIPSRCAIQGNFASKERFAWRNFCIGARMDLRRSLRDLLVFNTANTNNERLFRLVLARVRGAIDGLRSVSFVA